MTISSRTPGGIPSRCVPCGAENAIEFSEPTADAPCPQCGHLLWQSSRRLDRVRAALAHQLDLPPLQITADSSIRRMVDDSLDLVELVMELEDDYGVTIPDADYGRITTIGDLVRHLERFPDE